MQLVRLLLRAGQLTPYSAKQTTRLLDGRLRESRQLVKHAGPGRERIEYTAPPALRGGVVLTLGDRLYQYVPRPQPRVLEGYVYKDPVSGESRGLLAALRQGHVKASVVGQEELAGRTAAILELRGPTDTSTRRIWIDTTTGVRLRTDSVDAQGAIVATSYFTAIDYHPTFDDVEFTIASLPSAPRELMAPRSRRLVRLEEAEQLAHFRVREPDLPATFVRQGIWVIGRGARATVVMRYSDGLNVVAFSQRRVADVRQASRWRMRNDRSEQGRPVQWSRGGILYSLVGQLPPETARRVMAATQ